MERLFKIALFVPPEYKDRMMDAITDSISKVVENYDRTFSFSQTTGTWRTLDGADPFIGSVGKISEVPEIRLEFVVKESDLKNTVKAIRNAHPYEEPAMDIIETLDWHSLIL